MPASKLPNPCLCLSYSFYNIRLKPFASLTSPPPKKRKRNTPTCVPPTLSLSLSLSLCMLVFSEGAISMAAWARQGTRYLWSRIGSAPPPFSLIHRRGLAGGSGSKPSSSRIRQGLGASLPIVSSFHRYYYFTCIRNSCIRASTK